MTLTSPAVIVGDDDNGLLTRIREGAATLSFVPRGTVRCRGMPLFRTQAARDLACLLDVDPDVESWSCLPMVLHHAEGMHVPDFAVVRSSGTVLVDAVRADATPPLPWVPDAARAVGCGYGCHAEADLRDGFRLDNARDLLRYAA